MNFLRRFKLIPLLLILAGCAGVGQEVRWSEPGIDLVWPEPPEKPRLKYLRTLSGPQDFRKESKGARLSRWMFGEAEQGFPLVSPYGVAADGAGRVWVTDPGSGKVHVFDLARREVTYWENAGKQPLVSPMGICWEEKRELVYVSDSVLRKVFVYSSKGEFLGSREPPGGYARPTGVGVDGGGNLYVADAIAGKVIVFSSDGEYLHSIGSFLCPSTEFNRPSNLALDNRGNLFVVDSLNFRIEVISPDRKSSKSIGIIGDSPGSFARPRGVAIDSEGHVYVSDAAFDNIQVFDQEGGLLLYLGKAGRAPGEFNLPAALYFDSENHLYVVDALNRRIQVFKYLDGT